MANHCPNHCSLCCWNHKRKICLWTIIILRRSGSCHYCRDWWGLSNQHYRNWRQWIHPINRSDLRPQTYPSILLTSKIYVVRILRRNWYVGTSKTIRSKCWRYSSRWLLCKHWWCGISITIYLCFQIRKPSSTRTIQSASTSIILTKQSYGKLWCFQ